jgi:hypothetical protein
VSATRENLLNEIDDKLSGKMVSVSLSFVRNRPNHINPPETSGSSLDIIGSAVYGRAAHESSDNLIKYEKCWAELVNYQSGTSSLWLHVLHSPLRLNYKSNSNSETHVQRTNAY